MYSRLSQTCRPAGNVGLLDSWYDCGLKRDVAVFNNCFLSSLFRAQGVGTDLSMLLLFAESTIIYVRWTALRLSHLAL